MRDILENTFHFSSFRENQLEAINATLSGKDVFVVLPTGAGKSLIFQLPALLSEGVTLVISPLLSLSLDQVENAQKTGIRAGMLFGKQEASEKYQVYDELRADNLSLLYVTPEMVVKSTKLMGVLQDAYSRGCLARVVIDEAHCMSTMGHDFRADYKKLFTLKRQFPECPLLAVTATATQAIEQDIHRTLFDIDMDIDPQWVVFRSSFNRTNLRYRVLDKAKVKEGFKRQVVDLISSEFKHQAGIVYCTTKKQCGELSAVLNEAALSSKVYHAGRLWLLS